MTRNGRGLGLVACTLLLAGAGRAGAQTPECDALSGADEVMARQIFSALHPYDGCDDTFARCLARPSPESVVLRLASSICRQIAAGQGPPEIERALSRRAQSLLPLGIRARIELDEKTRAGGEDAPITAVVYACARCPFCSVVVPALHAAVTDGPLAGKVRLYFRPFPLKDHPGATEGGLAMVAAAELGRFWPFLLTLYARYDSFAPERLPAWAEEVGLSPEAFRAAMEAPASRQRLVDDKREGLRNGVGETPALFIDGRRYVYDLTPEAVIDVLEEAYEAASPAEP
jgi:protein-disulfide isomerase